MILHLELLLLKFLEVPPVFKPSPYSGCVVRGVTTPRKKFLLVNRHISCILGACEESLSGFVHGAVRSQSLEKF